MAFKPKKIYLLRQNSRLVCVLLQKHNKIRVDSLFGFAHHLNC